MKNFTIKLPTDTNTITQSELKSDIIIEFNDVSEMQSAIISFSKKLQKFVLEFNGKLIHSSKTFNSTIHKLDLLVNAHELEIMTVEQFS